MRRTFLQTVRARRLRCRKSGERARRRRSVAAEDVDAGRRELTEGRVGQERPCETRTDAGEVALVAVEQVDRLVARVELLLELVE